jgi:hypothetical protein
VTSGAGKLRPGRPRPRPGQIAGIYAERWESETGYADLKTYLRGHRQILRSKDPDGVAQEIYALLIVYQLVQLARIQAAEKPFTLMAGSLRRSAGMILPSRMMWENSWSLARSRACCRSGAWLARTSMTSSRYR